MERRVTRFFPFFFPQRQDRMKAVSLSSACSVVLFTFHLEVLVSIDVRGLLRSLLHHKVDADADASDDEDDGEDDNDDGPHGQPASGRLLGGGGCWGRRELADVDIRHVDRHQLRAFVSIRELGDCRRDLRSQLIRRRIGRGGGCSEEELHRPRMARHGSKRRRRIRRVGLSPRSFVIDRHHRKAIDPDGAREPFRNGAKEHDLVKSVTGVLGVHDSQRV